MKIRQGYNGGVWYGIYMECASHVKNSGKHIVQEICISYVKHAEKHWIMVIDNGKWFKISDNVKLEMVLAGGIWEYYRDVWKCSW